MITLCSKCNNHYDNSYQLPECDGPGPSHWPGTGNHKDFAQSPLQDHIDATRHRPARPRVTNVE